MGKRGERKGEEEGGGRRWGKRGEQNRKRGERKAVHYHALGFPAGQEATVLAEVE